MRHSALDGVSNPIRNERLLWTRPWDGGSRWQPHTDMMMQLATGRPGGRIAWRILVLLHFTLEFGYRRKVLFPAIWLPVVDLSWCIFFGIACVPLPFKVKSAAWSHGEYEHQWPWQSPVTSEDLMILCCSPCKSLSLGLREKGWPRWPPGSLPAQITPWIYEGDI